MNLTNVHPLIAHPPHAPNPLIPNVVLFYIYSLLSLALVPLPIVAGLAEKDGAAGGTIQPVREQDRR